MEMLNKLLTYIEQNTPSVFKVTLALLGLTAITLAVLPRPHDITAASVMILNGQKSSGGTGVVLSSSKGKSTIVTNAHVCGVVKHGGIVQSRGTDYLVGSYKKSQKYDLCLVTVNANLKASTKIASKSPVSYKDSALISGHPALYPNVVTTGHFSGNRILPVVAGVEKCTGKEQDQMAFFCMLLGVKPIIKMYESTLVTATIMAGSSGSGVYNTDNELAGLVFAGSQGLSYAWTVPYDSLVDFINSESSQISETVLGAFNMYADQNEDETRQRNARHKLNNICNNDNARQKLGDYCETVLDDVIWRK